MKLLKECNKFIIGVIFMADDGDLDRNATYGDIVRLRKEIKKWKGEIEENVDKHTSKSKIEEMIDNHKIECNRTLFKSDPDVFWKMFAVLVAIISPIATWIVDYFLF